MATDVFRIQLKGTCSSSFSADDEFISVASKALTVRYCSRVVVPEFLVICDLSVNEDPVGYTPHYVCGQEVPIMHAFHEQYSNRNKSYKTAGKAFSCAIIRPFSFWVLESSKTLKMER